MEATYAGTVIAAAREGSALDVQDAATLDAVHPTGGAATLYARDGIAGAVSVSFSSVHLCGGFFEVFEQMFAGLAQPQSGSFGTLGPDFALSSAVLTSHSANHEGLRVAAQWSFTGTR